MPYTVKKRTTSFRYDDIRGRSRTRLVETGILNIVHDDDANDMNAVSKSALIAYQPVDKQVNLSLTAASDSEVGDTGRLYFTMEDGTRYHFDIVDPRDDLFVATVGEAANVFIAYSALDVTNDAQKALKAIIDRVLSGGFLIADGEKPHHYNNGRRI